MRTRAYLSAARTADPRAGPTRDVARPLVTRRRRDRRARAEPRAAGTGLSNAEEHAGPRRRIADVADEITCLIADDHEVVREGLRLALSRSPRIRVIGEATDGASAVALAERRRPDVVIMDLRMPDMDGLEATEQVLAQGARDRRPHLHGVRRALAPPARPRVGRARLHPQGGAARDAAARDREGRRGRDVRRPGAHGRVRRRHRGRPTSSPRASARSSSCSRTGCRTRTSRRSSSSARRP